MNGIRDAISPATLAALLAFTQAHPLAGTLTHILDEAVADWLARQTIDGQADTGAGYRWKCLFLPSGTEVRIEYSRVTYHAKVIGDDLIFRDKPVSPRQMLLQLTGLTGNAWHWLMIRRPGERTFARASVLRAKLQRSCAPASALPYPLAIERRLADALERLERISGERRRAMPRRLNDFSEIGPNSEFCRADS